MKLNNIYGKLYKHEISKACQRKVVIIKQKSDVKFNNYLVTDVGARSHYYIMFIQRMVLQTHNASYWSEKASVMYGVIARELNILKDYENRFKKGKTTIRNISQMESI